MSHRPTLLSPMRCLAITMILMLSTNAPAKSIETLTARPDVPGGRESPLCILLPGGEGGMQQATRVMSRMGNLLAERGWIVVVPVSPDGASFFGDAADHVISVMNRYESDPDVRTGRVLLAGVSNGGIAALQVAGMVPDRVGGVIAVPGVLHQDVSLRRLRNLPVYLRIGEDDNLRWGDAFPRITQTLEGADVRLDAKLLKGVGHHIPIDWDEIDAWIARELGAMAPTIKKRQTHIALPEQAAQIRRWTSRNGATVDAALVEIRGNQVLLLRRGGQPARIPLKNLSREDQAYLASLMRAADP